MFPDLPGPPLDTRTLLFATAMVSFVMAAFTASVARSMPEQARGLRLWTLANSAAGVAFLMYFLRGHIPFGLSFVGANVAVTAVPALFLHAQARLLDAPPRRQLSRWAVGLATVSVLPALFDPHLGWLAAVVVSGAIATLAGAIAHLMWTDPQARTLASSRFVGLAAASAAAAVAWRAGSSAWRALQGMSYDIHATAPAHTVSLLLGGLFLVAASVSFMSTVHELSRRAISERARRDGLTGVLTRTAFYEEARQRLAAQPGARYAVAMIDVDHFKRINDGHGHAAGDQAIVHLAREVSANARVGDLVGRYGGEEFIVLLDGADLAAAHRFGQRLVDSVRQTSVRLPNGLSLSCTVSAGVAEGLPTRTAGSQDLEQTIALADAALYIAKAQGRDRVHSALEAT
ncbi:GGDEF domain-containing protein [Ideonella sp. 4Y16]|uniref:GGDEF domain-containing protein n=1 Tax=Ideonella alba TaxID=2824118 RepID=UPI001B38C8B8|nr:GGDEF domain-containing protein [Ideonella alba]MBQ0944009.1 GGDEF domain-containing protein [Ideonella alba]